MSLTDNEAVTAEAAAVYCRPRTECTVKPSLAHSNASSRPGCYAVHSNTWRLSVPCEGGFVVRFRRLTDRTRHVSKEHIKP